MGLFGLIIAMVVNIFVQSTALDLTLSVLGVLIFAGLTAYDTQKIKGEYLQLAGRGDESLRKVAVMSALTLYLDFVNLFLTLLRLLGNKR